MQSSTNAPSPRKQRGVGVGEGDWICGKDALSPGDSFVHGVLVATAKRHACFRRRSAPWRTPVVLGRFLLTAPLTRPQRDPVSPWEGCAGTTRDRGDHDDRTARVRCLSYNWWLRITHLPSPFTEKRGRRHSFMPCLLTLWGQKKHRGGGPHGKGGFERDAHLCKCPERAQALHLS